MTDNSAQCKGCRAVQNTWHMSWKFCGRGAQSKGTQLMPTVAYAGVCVSAWCLWKTSYRGGERANMCTQIHFRPRRPPAARHSSTGLLNAARQFFYARAQTKTATGDRFRRAAEAESQIQAHVSDDVFDCAARVISGRNGMKTMSRAQRCANICVYKFSPQFQYAAQQPANSCAHCVMCGDMRHGRPLPSTCRSQPLRALRESAGARPKCAC